ncbi:MAG: hypothetical protein ACOC8L_14665 [Spirochaetota bacterium]
MATIEQVTYTHFSTLSGLPLHFVEAVNPTLPYAVMFLVSDPNAKVLLSRYGGQARIQFDVYSDNRFELPDEMRKIKLRAREFAGTASSGYRVMNATVVNELQRDADTDSLYRGVVEVIVEYIEEG